jgi:hypothetical protein
MSIIIASSNTLDIVKEGGGVFVISKDKQFRNSYKNAWNQGRLYGVGYYPDGRVVDISRWLSDSEFDWLFGNMVRHNALIKI